MEQKPRSTALALLPHPKLWPEAVRTAVAFAPRGWWRRPPFFPKPDRRYLAWRRATAYGSDDKVMEPDDVRDYLRWRQRFRHG